MKFVDTPEAQGNGNGQADRIKRLEKQRRTLRFYLGVTQCFIVILVIALIAALWPGPVQAADYTSVRPATPGYSRVLPAPLPASEGVVVQGPDGSPVVLRDAKQAEKADPPTNRFWAGVAVFLGWIYVMVRII